MVPMLNQDSLFSLLKGERIFSYLKPFNSPGSIPASVGWGMVNKHPELYDMVANPVVTGTLQFHSLVTPTYCEAGVVMSDVNTGARYFMMAEEYRHMLEQTVCERNQITGSWSVIKNGHAFSLKWTGAIAKDDPEQRRQD